MKELSLKNCRLDERYDIRERLGRGSYAEIYVAQDSLASEHSPHKFVVIKALNVFMQNDLDLDLERTLVENFQNEAIALDRVRHPNVISRLGHGTARDLRGTVFHYLILEYMPGGDLAKFCRQKSLNLQQALNYIEQICAGLSHAHKNGVIHRDIKPQNLLLTADKKIVKIADFGVARFSQTDSPITRVGTNIYAPPEHSPMFAGQTDNLSYQKLTPAADIYSLAKSAYVLLTNESPRFFANQTITELPLSIRQKPWANQLLEVLKRATQNDPRNRFQNVDEFWNELSKLSFLDKSNGNDVAIQEVLSKSNAMPQPQFTKGYSPLAPQKPIFDTSEDLKIKNTSVILDNSIPVKINQNPLSSNPVKINQNPLPTKTPPIVFAPKQEFTPAEIPDDKEIQQKPKSNSLRIAAIALILLGLFAVTLYGTYNYLLNRGIGTSSSVKMGTATTDINLRPAPTTIDERIGLITKNSRLQIVNIENNWYEVIITEQGRTVENVPNAKRGWAYGASGKYIKLDE